MRWWLNFAGITIAVFYLFIAVILTLGTKFGGERTWLQAIWSGVTWPWVLFKK